MPKPLGNYSTLHVMLIGHSLLVQVAKIDAIELGQYELYSSRVKDFELSRTLNNVRSASKTSSDDTSSRILNSPHWQPVANFTAAKVKGTQTFKLRQVAWSWSFVHGLCV